MKLQSEENPNALRTFLHGIAFMPLLGYGLNMPGLDPPWYVPGAVLNAFYLCTQSFETGHLVRWRRGREINCKVRKPRQQELRGLLLWCRGWKAGLTVVGRQVLSLSLSHLLSLVYCVS